MSKSYDKMKRITLYPKTLKAIEKFQSKCPIPASVPALANEAIVVGLVKLQPPNRK
jgi:hypothetical protein